jgi:hypothetical protein
MDIANDGLEFVNVCEKTLASAFGDAIDSLEATGIALLFHRHDTEFGQGMHVPVEIAVGEIARGRKFGKTQAVRMRDQTRTNR